MNTPREFLALLAEAIGGKGVDTWEIWHIVSALRGPDHGNDRLKELTTARIRAIVGISSKHVTVHSYPLTIEERQERDILLSEASQHFRSHYRDACIAIRFFYGYNLQTEEKVQP